MCNELCSAKFYNGNETFFCSQRLNEKSYEKLIGDQALIDWAICDGLDADKTLFVGRECGMSPSNPSRKYVTLHKVNFAGQVTATPDVSYRSHLEALIKEHQSKQVGKVSQALILFNLDQKQ